jgi:hypothetical protein
MTAFAFCESSFFFVIKVNMVRLIMTYFLFYEAK